MKNHNNTSLPQDDEAGDFEITMEKENKSESQNQQTANNPVEQEPVNHSNVPFPTLSIEVREAIYDYLPLRDVFHLALTSKQSYGEISQMQRTVMKKNICYDKIFDLKNIKAEVKNLDDGMDHIKNTQLTDSETNCCTVQNSSLYGGFIVGGILGKATHVLSAATCGATCCPTTLAVVTPIALGYMVHGVIKCEANKDKKLLSRMADQKSGLQSKLDTNVLATLEMQDQVRTQPEETSLVSSYASSIFGFFKAITLPKATNELGERQLLLR